MTVNGRGNYYGITSMDYYIVPKEVKSLTAKAVGEDAVLLEWVRGNNGVDGADGYKVYLDDGDSRVDSGDKLMADITGTSYVVRGLEAGNHTFYVVAYAYSDNDTENGKIYNCPTASSIMSFASATTETTVPEMVAPEVTEGESETEAKITVTFEGAPKTDGSWSVIVTAYDENGMMVGVTSQTITGESLTVALQGIQSAERVTVYVVSSNCTPLAEAAVVDMTTGELLSAELELFLFEDTENQVFVEEAEYAE